MKNCENNNTEIFILNYTYKQNVIKPWMVNEKSRDMEKYPEYVQNSNI